MTMQPDVDIARAWPARRSCPDLAGLVTWWRAVQDLPAVITPITPPTSRPRRRRSAPHRRDTAFGPVVGQLHALLTAASDREPLVVAIGDGTTSDTSAGTYAERSAPERTVMPPGEQRRRADDVGPWRRPSATRRSELTTTTGRSVGRSRAMAITTSSASTSAAL